MGEPFLLAGGALAAVALASGTLLRAQPRWYAKEHVHGLERLPRMQGC